MWVILGQVKHSGSSAGKEKFNMKNYLLAFREKEQYPKAYLPYYVFGFGFWGFFSSIGKI